MAKEYNSVESNSSPPYRKGSSRAEDKTVTRKQKGILVDEDAWHQLKVFCARDKLFIVDQAGKIIEEWVAENCHEQSP